MQHLNSILLYNKGQLCGKKTSCDLFYVTISSIGGAESRVLESAYLLYNIKEKYGYNFGLYRNDSLGVTQASFHQAEQIKKTL